MESSVAEEINQLKNDDLHGASWLAVHTINTLNLAVNQSRAVTIQEYIKEIRQVAEDLSSARPNITPIAYYGNQFLYLIMTRAKIETNVDELRRFAESKGKELLKTATRAFSKTVEYASSIISDLETVITCSYSSTVCQVLEQANQREARFHVLVAKSKFGNRAYGELTATELMKHQILAEIIPDGSISYRISKADKALVGADSITGDGYLINGKPTLLLAQAAKSKNIPFFVACESSKFTICGYVSKSIELEPGFDRTPLSLVTGIITEKGTMLPSLVMSYIEAKSEEMAHVSTAKGE
jgi:translation initiation factor 2B subunit (eIF-2B alpha/beta/delta family)